MNCPFDKEKLSGYYDGELGAAERSEVERHIASCSECLRDLGELKSAALLVKDLPRLRAPKSIAEGVSLEIRAAGKLHSMAKVRRVVLWATAAAAGLFVVMNVAVLSRQAPAPGANEPTVALAPAARSAAPPAAAETAPRASEERALPDRAAEPEANRRFDLRKNLGESAEKRAPAEVLEESKKLDQAREKAAAPAGPAAKPSEALAKAEQAPPPPTVGAPAPAPPAAPGRAVPAPTAPPADALRGESGLAADKDKPTAAKEKPAATKEADAAKKSEADPKSNAAAAAGAPAELPPAQFNVVARELAKARPRLEDSLKKMGLGLPPPPPQPLKQPRNRDAENTIVLELTDAQLARLQADLEKPGDARLVQTPTVEPVLPGFRGNGLFGKKDGASGGAKAASAGKDKEMKDGKEADDAAALAAGPRRKVTLHLVESKNLPPAEGEPPPPQKN